MGILPLNWWLIVETGEGDTEKLSVLYEDNHLLAVVKRSGILVQGDRSGQPTLLDAAKAYLREKYDKPGNVFIGLVHRLDRPVSGVVLLARTSKAARRLGPQFKAGTVRKLYDAVVTGIPEPAEATLTAYLGARADRHGKTEARRSPFLGAKRARLSYRIVERSDTLSLLEIELHTGRRHQIRAQLSLLGYPVLGDIKYGAPRRLPDRTIALHARELVVQHPVTGQTVTLLAPRPASWPWLSKRR